MALQPALTWTTLFAHYSAAAWTPLLQLARTTYAQQGQLLTAAHYLALPPAAAAAPFVAAPAAVELLAAALPASGGEAPSTYAEYAAGGDAQTQPLLRALGDALTAQGITPAEFETGLAAQGAGTYLSQVLTPGAWAIVAEAAQHQAQYRLDEAGRSARLLASAPALAPAYGRVLAALPGVSLEALVALPANELARALWTPAPTANEVATNQISHTLQVAAQRVIAQNHPDSEQPNYLLALLDPDLQGVAQALLLPAAPAAPALSIAELAQNSLDELGTRLAALPANHPVVYALAAALQAAGQRFLLAEAPAALVLPGPLSFSARLLDVAGAPLVGFGLALYQLPAGTTEGERALGSLTTDGEGRIDLRVTRNLYLADDDTVAETPVEVRAEVYRPGQDQASEPLLTLLLTPTVADEEVTFSTGLDATILNAPPASAPLTTIAEDLPADLRNTLAANGLATLADVRAAGGLQSLLAGLDSSPETAVAARRVDGLAQFEVVSADFGFNNQVVAAGFYSPGQLLDTASPQEFVQRLGLAEAPAEQRAQAQAFYQQVATTQALSQALGLLLAGTPAPGTAPSNEPTLSLSLATVGRRAGAAAGRRAGAAAGETTADSSAEATPEANASLDPDADPAGNASAQRQIPGVAVTPSFNPAPNAVAFGYDSSQQCDCPACRSAVSPTAYLAALLSYATTNLRASASQVTRAALQARFHQPFTDLRVSCQAAEEPVCQYRLAIEVLHAHAQAEGKDPLTIDQTRPYLEAMLEALLQALGTSLAELRTTPAAQLPALATRLAIPEATLTRLRTEFAPDKLLGTNSLAGLEARLEEFFGLASTSRDSLSSGFVLSDNTGPMRLLRWSLQGLEWGVNTSPDGSLLVEVTADPAASPGLVVVVYKAGLTPTEETKVEDNVVARGDLHILDWNNPAHDHAALLYPQHGSGLSGSLQLAIAANTQGSSTFHITAMPAVTASQQQVLHDGWLRQDAAPLDLVRAHDAASWNGYHFLIDPDLLGPDDFRPGAPHSAYAIWRRRYEFLQTTLPGLLLPAGTALSSSTLGQLIDGLPTREVSYTTLGNSTVPVKLWAKATLTGTGTAVLAGLHAALAGTPAPTTQLANLGLSAEGAQRLYELWQLSLAKTLIDSDFQEALDLVRQSAKKALEDTWVGEELSAGLQGLSLDDFQPALHEPQPGLWQVVRPRAFGLDAAQQGQQG
jgi:hypothetical protein